MLHYVIVKTVVFVGLIGMHKTGCSNERKMFKSVNHKWKTAFSVRHYRERCLRVSEQITSAAVQLAVATTCPNSASEEEPRNIIQH